MNLLDLAKQAKKKLTDFGSSVDTTIQQAKINPNQYNVFGNIPQIAQGAGNALQKIGGSLQQFASPDNSYSIVPQNVQIPRNVLQPLETAQNSFAAPVVNTASQFIQNRLAKPTINFSQNYANANDPTMPGWDRAKSALGAGLDLSALSPGGIGFSLGRDIALGGIQDIRQGNNIGSGAVKSLTGERYTGLGDSVTDNPLARDILNVAELPLMIGAGAGKNALVKSKVGQQVSNFINPKIVMHPEDVKYLDSAYDALRNKKSDQNIVSSAVDTIDKLAEGYLPKDLIDKVKGDPRKMAELLRKRASYKPNVVGNFGMNLVQNSPMEGGKAPGQYILRQGQKNVSVMASPTTKNELRLKDKVAGEREARSNFDQWNRSLKKQEGVRTTTGAVNDLAKAIKQNTKGAPAQGVENLKDISGFSGQNKDVYRIFKDVYGARFNQVKEQVLDPFDRSKGSFVDEMETQAKFLDEKIVKGLGIKKGSKESAAVMEFGEKKRDASSLIAEFGQEKANKIIQADNTFRETYNRLLDEVNQVRGKIYPNSPDKIIPKRSDYYRHFKEITQDFSGLKNIFDDPSGISSSLSGVSEYVKPKSKFLSFAQKRLGDKSDMDAVGGFIDYIRAFSYAKHIDPQISKFRALADDLAKATEEGPEKGKLNNFIEFLQDYSNDLSGKTNPADRWIQKVIPGGRKAMKVVDWVNSRVKANTVVGNVGSMVAQLFNLPQGIASAGPVHFTKGAGRTLASIFDQDRATKQSTFLKERYAGTMFNKFDTKLLDKGANFAGWVTGVWDEAATKLIWNSHYEKALKEGVSNAVKYADDATRSLVAGRGIGEVPLLQKSKIVQLGAPFQLEVNNMWYVMKDWVDQKQFGKFATFFAVSYLMNRMAENVRGSDVSFDPINAMAEAGEAFNKEEDKAVGAIKAGGRVAGELISNTPYVGQVAGSLYPEYGFKVNDAQFPTREQFFGSKDPTRFGQGLIAEQALKDPLFKLIPRVGGGQIKKTIEGVQSYQQGYSETKKGQVRFPIDQTPENYARSALFGQYGSTNAREYFKEGAKPLGKEQSVEFKEGGGTDFYKETLQDRQEKREDKALEPKDDSRSFLQKLFSMPEPDAESASAEEAMIDTYVEENSEGLTPLQKEKLKKDIKDKKREYKRILRNDKLNDDEKNKQLSVVESQIKTLQESDNKKKVKTSYLDTQLTGDKTTDKAIMAKKRGELTTMKNDLIKQYDDGEITAEELTKGIKDLEDQAGKSGGSKKLKISASSKAPKIALQSPRKSTPLKFSTSTSSVNLKPSKIKLGATKQKKISIKKPNIKKITLKKKS